MQRRVSRPGVLDRRDRGVPDVGRAQSTSASTATTLLDRSRRAARRREGRRLVQRPHGVRPARARRAQHPRRSAQPADAGADEPQDQVPRGLPAVRAERAARAGERLVRAGLRLALHAAGGAGEEGAADPDDRRGSSGSGASTSSTCRGRTSRPSPTSTTRRASRPCIAETNPDYYDLIEAFEALTGCAVLVNTSFNVRGEPIVCTPGGRVSLLHADPHRLLWCWVRFC